MLSRQPGLGQLTTAPIDDIDIGAIYRQDVEHLEGRRPGRY